MCFGCSKELSHRDGSFEYPQHMFWFRNKKNNFQLRILILGPEILVYLSMQSNKSLKQGLYGLPCLSQKAKKGEED